MQQRTICLLKPLLDNDFMDLEDINNKRLIINPNQYFKTPNPFEMNIFLACNSANLIYVGKYKSKKNWESFFF